jgi:hypothetical protein
MRPADVKTFARCVRAWVCSPASRKLAEEFGIDTEHGWRSGGCAVLAEAVLRVAGRGARLFAELDQDGDPVHVLAEVAPGAWIDAGGLVTVDDYRRGGWPLPVRVTQEIADQIGAWAMTLPEYVEPVVASLSAACRLSRTAFAALGRRR